MSARKPRECIVCGHPTMDRTQPHNTPRCADFEPCATRRDASRKYPRTQAGRELKARLS
jgi:hypothetical protein